MVDEVNAQAPQQLPEPSEEIKSRFYSRTGDTPTGAWHYPAGGGYEATASRVETRVE